MLIGFLLLNPLAGAAVGTAAGGIIVAIAGHTGVGLALGAFTGAQLWLSLRSSREGPATGTQSSLQ